MKNKKQENKMSIRAQGLKSLKLLHLSLVLLCLGCALTHKEKVEDVLVVEPNIAALVVPGDYASGALAATGGVVTWTKMIRLDLDGVVTFYQPGGSSAGLPGNFYLTEHHFEVYPWSDSIRISAAEPQGRFVWQLAGGQFSLLEGNEAADIAPKVISSRDYAEAVLTIITAPVRFLDQNVPSAEATSTGSPQAEQAISGAEGAVSFQKSTTPVKIDSLWYYQIERSIPAAQNYGKVVFFQNKNNNLVDIIWFVDTKRNKFLAVRGYDYKAIQKDGVSVPTKIEIFRTDARMFFKERLIKVDLPR
jgi:hypothetical protein